MFLIFTADYHNFAVSFDNFAFVAHRLNAGSDFHMNLLKSLFVSVDNYALGKVVG